MATRWQYLLDYKFKHVSFCGATIKLKSFPNQMCLKLNCLKSIVPKIKYVHNKHVQNIKCPNSKVYKNKCTKSSAKQTLSKSKLSKMKMLSK